MQSTNNIFLLKTNLGCVVPSYSEQFRNHEEMNLILSGIAKAVANELAFIDLARRPDKLDWLPNLHAQIQDDWNWVESCLISFREIEPVVWGNMS